MADEGSNQILALLNEPSERLHADALDLVKALRRAPRRPYGVASQNGFDALADLQQFYRDLRLQIDAVDTEDPAKQDALDALDELDRSLGAFERGLANGYSKKSLTKLKRSDKLAGSAVKGLRAARRGLST